MLRRNFLKTGAIFISGAVLLNRLPQASLTDDNPIKRVINTGRHYAFSGHARSGCATPPEFQAHLEHGISRIIPEL
jgi:hypothetical protein